MTAFDDFVAHLSRFCDGELTKRQVTELIEMEGGLCNGDLTTIKERLQEAFRILEESIRKLKKTEGSTETRTLCLSLMMHLAICNNELPRSLYIGDDAAFIVDCPNEHSQGAFGKVYKVSRIRDKKVVAIKVPQGWVQNEMKSWFRELLIWHHVEHEHILAFIGICKFMNFYPSLVSPWMERGTLRDNSETLEVCMKYILLSQVASALEYLHNLDPPIIHEDVRAANILISDNRQALLADFGISRIDSERFADISLKVQHGNTRWLAPELLLGSKGQNPKPRSEDDSNLEALQRDRKVVLKASKHTDVWSFGMTVLEVLTNARPYAKYCNDAFVIIQLYNRILPERPDIRGENGEAALSDGVWTTVSHCWREIPEDRPKASKLRRELTKAAKKCSHQPREGLRSQVRSRRMCPED